MYRKLIKPFLDIVIALILVIIFSPLLFLITIGLLIVNKGKPFFFQLRPGKDEKLFKIIKFKTMTDECDKNGNLLPDAERLKSLGKIVRATSLDEIPQLLNVLQGSMSLVGPRPLLPEYIDLYTKKQKKRHAVKPGITGWAQVNGRNAISWKKKLEYDVWYVQNQSFYLDFKILLKTTEKVLLKEGINTKGEATTRRFTGKKKL
ncbi:sugar transferase [Marixanthomonas ophiurae]|uniref:Sugar transferase n=1 Tax=Marixanthomonas ophiurae TaxID=387659 RepID=A0A3E1Q785_9FLAO|nr:sugar transferase [Marixanthomonas ophiurae]RFN57982.1 sugar transferase [Marixanthomonas ophiurae]